MSVFDLDPQGRKSLDQQAALNPLDLSTIKPGFFEGLGKATGMGVARGGARAGNAVDTDVLGTTPFETTEAQPYAGIIMEVRVRYRHLRTDPTAKN